MISSLSKNSIKLSRNCLSFLRELFCKSKSIFQRGGGSEFCVSLLFSIGSIQAVLLKTKHILIAKVHASYSQKVIRKQVSYPVV